MKLPTKSQLVKLLAEEIALLLQRNANDFDRSIMGSRIRELMPKSVAYIKEELASSPEEDEAIALMVEQIRELMKYKPSKDLADPKAKVTTLWSLGIPGVTMNPTATTAPLPRRRYQNTDYIVVDDAQTVIESDETEEDEE
jgi:hypothetical protein